MITPPKSNDVKGEALPEVPEVVYDDRLFHERNMLLLEGRYFSFAARKTRNEAKVEVLPPLVSDEEIIRSLKKTGKPKAGVLIVRPHKDYGHPGELAYKVLQAIQRLVSERRYEEITSIKFSYRQLAEACGRKWFGGKDIKELVHAINQLRHTTVKMTFYWKATDTYEDLDFNILIKASKSGKAGNANSTEGEVMLHPDFVKSLKDGHFLCINFSRFVELKEAITQTLFKRVYFHLSNLAHRHSRDTLSFTKNYAELCTEWLSGLVVKQHLSKIQEQLGKHFDELVRIGLLSSYRFERNAKRDGFNVVCLPGAAFFEDYERFYRVSLPDYSASGKLPELPAQSEDPASQIVRYFLSKKVGSETAAKQALLAARDLDFAHQLLAQHSLEECQRFIDFALEKARSTNFDVQALSGLKRAHVAFLGDLEARARDRAAREERSRREADEKQRQQLEHDYEAFRQARLAEIRTAMRPEDLERLEQAAHEKIKRQPIKLRVGVERLVRIDVDSDLAKSHHIPSFDEWRVGRRAGAAEGQ